MVKVVEKSNHSVRVDHKVGDVGGAEVYKPRRPGTDRIRFLAQGLEFRHDFPLVEGSEDVQPARRHRHRRRRSFGPIHRRLVGVCGRVCREEAKLTRLYLSIRVRRIVCRFEFVRIVSNSYLVLPFRVCRLCVSLSGCACPAVSDLALADRLSGLAPVRPFPLFGHASPPPCFLSRETTGCSGRSRVVRQKSAKALAIARCSGQSSLKLDLASQPDADVLSPWLRSTSSRGPRRSFPELHCHSNEGG